MPPRHEITKFGPALALAGTLVIAACTGDAPERTEEAAVKTVPERQVPEQPEMLSLDISAIPPEMDLMDAARERIRSVEQADPKVRALARRRLSHSAKHAVLHGRYRAAELLIDHGLSVLEASALADDDRVADERADLADAQRELGHYGEADRNFRLALALKRRANPTRYDAITSILRGMALNHRDWGRNRDAVFLLERVLAQVELDATQGGKPNDARHVGVLDDLADVHHRLKHDGEAEALFGDALEIAERSGDENLVWKAVAAAGRFNRERGDFAKAEAFFKRNLASDEANGRAGDPRLSASFNALAELYMDQGRFSKAEPLLEHALANLDERLGPIPPLTGRIAQNLANIMTASARFADAKAMFRRSFAIKRATIGTDHPDFAAALADLAAWYDAQGQAGKAQALLKRAADTYARAFGPTHPKAIAARNDYLRAQRSSDNDLVSAAR